MNRERYKLVQQLPDNPIKPEDMQELSHLPYPIFLLPEVLKIADEDRLDRPLSSYVNSCILKCHGECQSTRILNAFQEWLERVVEACHSTKKHEPEYVVVLHKLTSLREKEIEE